MIQLYRLHVYPIKSLDGIDFDAVCFTHRGGVMLSTVLNRDAVETVYCTYKVEQIILYLLYYPR